MLIYIRCRRIPELGVVVLGAFVLNHTLDIYGNALMFTNLRLHQHLQFAAVGKRFSKLAIRQEDFPNAVADVLQRELIAVPIIEVAHQREVMRGRCPFAIPPAMATFVVVEAQKLMRRGEIFKATVTVFDVVQPPFIAVVAVVNSIADGV